MRIAAFVMFLAILCALVVGPPVRTATAASPETINKEILSQVDESGTVQGYVLDVETREGTVWLRGHVTSLGDKATVERIARNVKGVDEVKNELAIEAATAGAPELANRVRENIRPLSSSGEHDIVITAEGTNVVLEGAAGSSAQRKRIETAARNTSGVVTVQNNLKISRPPDIEIAEAIRREISEVPEIKIKDLKVLVQEGVVVLSGAGNSHRDIDHALALALNVPGVEDVKSEFTPKMP